MSWLAFWDFEYATASSMSLAYSAFLEAARIREGFVVASWGLYLAMEAKSPCGGGEG